MEKDKATGEKLKSCTMIITELPERHREQKDAD
jgi:hypothetical protein